MFPPVPSWDALHPLVVHFPIALFAVAPLFVLLGILSPSKADRWSGAALLLLGLATVSGFVSTASGEAAAAVVERTPAVTEVLDHHWWLAEMARNAILVLTILYAGILVVLPRIKKLAKPMVKLAVNLAFLVLLLAGNLLLAHAAHQGARLVHEFGVHAIHAPSTQPGG